MTTNPGGPTPTDVDHYLESHLVTDSALAATLSHAIEASAASELPDIRVSAMQGKQLMLLARAIAARNILEIGTLGGYSTIWLAHGMASDGHLQSVELEETHARVAQSNIEHAGIAERVTIHQGEALPFLQALVEIGHTDEPGAAPFDFIFVDADKENYPAYLNAAIELSEPGTMIILDNTVRDGAVADPDAEDPRVHAVRAVHEQLRSDSRVTATTIQTQGCKGWDGYTLVMVH